jgi:hypothetical protein
MKRPWLHHAFWNTLEQGVTRATDALTGLVLIWALQPEIFSQLVMAQAWAAPTLLLFLSPEGAVYRELAEWKKKGPDCVAGSLRALRLFAWAKVVAALAASLLLAAVIPGRTAYAARIAAVLWAYFIALGPQIAGPDREFLRLELRLRTVNALTIVQKTILLGGTILVSTTFGMRLAPLAAVAGLSATVCALAAWRCSAALLLSQGASAEGLGGRRGPPVRETLSRTLMTFTLWQHLSMTVSTWIRTMDLFFLGLFGIPARVLGLYGAALKVANLATAVPVAAMSLFAIWLGRREEPRLEEERRFVLRITPLIGVGTLLIAVAIALVLPFVLPLLSHGRWTPREIATMTGWIHWMLAAGTVVVTPIILFWWLALRTSYARIFFEIYVPWTIVSLVLFAVAAGLGGAEWAARMSVVVGAVSVVLVLIRFRRTK